MHLPTTERKSHRSMSLERPKTSTFNRSFNNNEEITNPRFRYKSNPRLNRLSPLLDYRAMTNQLHKEPNSNKLTGLPVQCKPLAEILNRRPSLSSSKHSRSPINSRPDSVLNKSTSKSMKNLRSSVEANDDKELYEYCNKLCKYLEKHKIRISKSNNKATKKQLKLDLILKVLGEKIQNKYNLKLNSYKSFNKTTDKNVSQNFSNQKSVDSNTNNIITKYFATLVDYLTGIISNNLSESCIGIISNKILKHKSNRRSKSHRRITKPIKPIINNAGDFEEHLAQISKVPKELVNLNYEKSNISTASSDNNHYINNSINPSSLLLIHRIVQCSFHIPCTKEPFINKIYDSQLIFNFKTIENFPIILKLSYIQFMKIINESDLDARQFDVEIITNSDKLKNIHKTKLYEKLVILPDTILRPVTFNLPSINNSLSIKLMSNIDQFNSKQLAELIETCSFATCLDTDNQPTKNNSEESIKACLSDNINQFSNTTCKLLSFSISLDNKRQPTDELSEITSILSKSELNSCCSSLEKSATKIDDESCCNLTNFSDKYQISDINSPDDEIFINKMINFSNNDNYKSNLSDDDNYKKVSKLTNIDQQTYITRNYFNKFYKVLLLPWFYHKDKISVA